ncbi:hypothetical protein [Streptomyces sp. NBC_00280]|uniref:hypothetical protein n=1 Tax=Streptomyces sp. NBC_00280 TaxID=2975699 RepID=UPI0032451281
MQRAEFLYSARDGREYDEIAEMFTDLYPDVPVPKNAGRWISAVQYRMARAGEHRSASAVDLVIAATAAHHGLSVLHARHAGGVTAAGAFWSGRGREWASAPADAFLAADAGRAFSAFGGQNDVVTGNGQRATGNGQRATGRDVCRVAVAGGMPAPFLLARSRAGGRGRCPRAPASRSGQLVSRKVASLRSVAVVIVASFSWYA